MANVAPLAPTLTFPPNNAYLVVAFPIPFRWDFHDPGDYQGQASLRYKKTGDAWTTLTNVVTSATEYVMPAATLAQPFTYEWQVQTTDSGGLVSPWSASMFLNTIAYIPGATITTPAIAAVVDVSPVPVAWTLPGGFTQDAYQLWLTDYNTAVDYYDSGVVEGVALSALAPMVAPVGASVEVIVRFRTNDDWANNSTHRITNAVLPPERPLIVLAQTPGMRPEVVVSITNPAPADAGHLATVSNDVARNGVPIAKDLPPGATFTDHLPGGGAVTYVCTAKTANGGTAQSF